MADPNTSHGQSPPLPSGQNTGKNSKKNKAKKAKAKAKKAQLQTESQPQSPVEEALTVPEDPIAQAPTDRRTSLLAPENHMPVSSIPTNNKEIGDAISGIAQESAIATRETIRRSSIADAEGTAREVGKFSAPAKALEEEPRTTELNSSAEPQAEDPEADDPMTLVSDLPTSELKEYIPEDKEVAVIEFEPTAEQLVEENSSRKPSIVSSHKELEEEHEDQNEPQVAEKEELTVEADADPKKAESESKSSDPIPWENVTKVPTLIDHPAIPTEEEGEEEIQANKETSNTATPEFATDLNQSGGLPWDSAADEKQTEPLPWETQHEEKEVQRLWEAPTEVKEPESQHEQDTSKSNNVDAKEVVQQYGVEGEKDQGSELPWDAKEGATTEATLPWVTEASGRVNEPLPWEENQAIIDDEDLPWNSNATEDKFNEDKFYNNEGENIEQGKADPLPWEAGVPQGQIESSQIESNEFNGDNNEPSIEPEPNQTAKLIHDLAKFDLPKSTEEFAGKEAEVSNAVYDDSVDHSSDFAKAPSEGKSSSKLENIFDDIDEEELDDGFFSKLGEVKKEKEAGSNQNTDKARSLSFLDDDDLLFEEEVSDAPVQSQPQSNFQSQQKPVPVRQHSYIPAGNPPSNRYTSEGSQPIIHSSDFSSKLNEVKKRNDAYDFPMPIVSDKVKPAPRRQQSNKYGPSSSTNVSSINPGPAKQQSISVPGTASSSTSISPSVTPAGPPKSFFEELPISMPKPAPRPPRAPRATNNPIQSPNNLQPQAHVQQPPHVSPNVNFQAQVNVKPNPYAPKISNAPPTPTNVRSGVVPPPALPPNNNFNQGNQNFNGGNIPSQAVPPPSILHPGQIQPFPQHPEQFPLVSPQQQNFPLQFGNSQRKLSNPQPSNTINTNVSKAPSSGSATSPYVPNAGPYAPNGHRRTHSRASSLVGGKGKEINPYAPALPVVNQANGPPQFINSGGNNLLPSTGVVPPTNPVSSPQVGPIPKSNLPPVGIASQQHQFSQQPQQPQQQLQLHPPPGGNRVRGMSNPKSSFYSRGQVLSQSQPAPKVQNPQALLSRQFPIFSWSNSGNVAYLIPKRTTNTYGNAPSEELTISGVTKLLRFNETLATFPGPLGKSSSKTKKKDLEKWLEYNIERMSKDELTLERSNEIVLNQILLALIQTNGDIRSKQFAEIICPILSPQINFKSDSPPSELASSSTISLGAPTGYKLDNSGLNVVLSFLQVGKVEEGISFCISKGDWTMALMIANIEGQEKFQKIASDYARVTFPFQKSQSKVHHLMPILLKAVNGSSSSVIQEFLSVPSEAEWALQHWRDIISSIFINGGKNSADFCIEFGKYLSGCPGFAIVSDICFILGGASLSPIVSPLNGVLFSIIGAETVSTSIYSEIFEFSLQLNPSVQAMPLSGLPHLYPLKLRYASLLADYGLFTESQRYCDFLGPVLKTSSGTSAQNSLIWREFKDLAMRLSSTNYQDSGWFGNKISKVNLDKMWGHLDKFIGGEEPKSNGENGVFSKFSPSVSRTASTLDFTALNATNPINSNSSTLHNHNTPQHGRSTYQENVTSSYPSAPVTASDNSTFAYNSHRTNEFYDGRVIQQPPPLVRNNTSGGSKYAPMSIQQLQQHSQPAEGYTLPQPPLSHYLENTSRYAPSNMSSSSLHLNNVNSDNQAKKIQRERQSSQVALENSLTDRPFSYMNPAGQYSNSSNLSHQASIDPTVNAASGEFKSFKSDHYQQAAHHSSSHHHNQLSNDLSPPNFQQQQHQANHELSEGRNSLIQSTPKAFHPSMGKRQSVESITTENFGNPEAIREHTHSPSAQSDISMDYPSDFKPPSRKFGFNSISSPTESPEKKRDVPVPIANSPDLKKVKPDFKQDESQSIPPPPVKPPPSSQRERVNPYAPGGSTKSISRKSKYGPPPGSVQNDSQIVPPPTIEGNMYSFGGYHTTTKEDIEASKDENKEVDNQSAPPHSGEPFVTQQQVEPIATQKGSESNQINIDDSFDGDFDNEKLRIPNPAKLLVTDTLGGVSPSVKHQSMYNSFQSDVDSLPRGSNFNNFGEFPVPGTPDYTTRANSVIGGNGGYFSSRLSQSHQSAMYQQYEVEDDTVQEYIPVVEEEDEEEDLETKKERELKLKKLEEEAKARAKVAEEEQKRRESEEKRKSKEKEEENKKHSGQAGGNGWFGGWLGGGKDDGKPKAIRAKLGEKNKFYYDEKLKKWINKDLPLEDQIKPSGPPPPPKMKMSNAPQRSSPSPGDGPPSHPTQSIGSNATPEVPLGGHGTPSTDGPKPPLGNTSTPSLSSAGSKAPSLATAGLDDLLSIGTPPAGGAPRKGKRGPKRGYVNVLNQDK
ncbi:COPII coat assembly protein Sec16p [[Candida] railenensis]|uniref:Protein transport protein sec16 n=1 Tax=[Candida] railenensis TaxID=45579 RepID=A0A9P0QNS7_9ASCO|nr:COPII coat assembly protein Sec16p [[Candida] railenensis]